MSSIKLCGSLLCISSEKNFVEVISNCSLEVDYMSKSSTSYILGNLFIMAKLAIGKSEIIFVN